MSPALSAALTGLGRAAAFIAGFIVLGELVSLIARTVIRRSVQQWRALRLERFWLVNVVSAPFILAYCAGAVWLTHLTAAQVGVNLDHLGLSVAVAVPLAIVLGAGSAFATRMALKQGLSIMRTPMGRTRSDVIGAIAYVAILVGPLEELPFRGLVQTFLMIGLPQSWLVGPFSVSLGTVLAALIFAGYHVRNVAKGGETLAQFFRLLPGRVWVSLILSLLFQGTGSLVGPVLFHNIVDTFSISTMSLTIYRMRQRGEWPVVAATPTPSGPTGTPSP